MKNFLKVSFVTALTFASASAMAAQYKCVSATGAQTVLTVQSAKSIIWSIDSESASSQGVFEAIDTAPYSDTAGELQYKLTDFFQSNDTAFYVSAPKAIAIEPANLKVTSYIDNDDHREEVTVFNCQKN